jgi:SMC interacting uncharacterized protein involved in chromosome segregation
MSGREPENGDPLIRFIAQTVEGMRDKIELMQGNIETMQGNIESMQGNIESMQENIDGMRHNMATKQGLAELRGEMLELHKDTKSDLRRLEGKLDAGLTAVRGDIERVAVRVENVDASVSLRFTAVDAAISRLRSVVYLLAKDQPELLRLLGPERA